MTLAWTYKSPMRSLSHFQPVLQLDLRWPWYGIFDLINKCGFQCCIYDPNEIHQSIWKLRVNFNYFHNRQQEKKECNVKGHLCLSCLGRWHKIMLPSFKHSFGSKCNHSTHTPILRSIQRLTVKLLLLQIMSANMFLPV